MAGSRGPASFSLALPEELDEVNRWLDQEGAHADVRDV
jgi:hypothetical protein